MEIKFMTGKHVVINGVRQFSINIIVNNNVGLNITRDNARDAMQAAIDEICEK